MTSASDSIIADLRSELPIDRHRVFASGFSNGGAFTARLAVERSTELAAAAFSGGGLDGPFPGSADPDVQHRGDSRRQGARSDRPPGL